MGSDAAPLGWRNMIVVTGAGGGIGRAILEPLSKVDRVIGVYNRTRPDVVESAALQLQQLDLLDPAAIQAFVEGRSTDLTSTTIVHCAAKSIDRLAVQFAVGEWDEVLNVNLKGPFLLNKAVVPGMIREQWGRLIHVSSIVGAEGAAGTTAYAASKSGLTGLARVFCKEYARFNVTSNVLQLGYFDTGLIDTLSEKARDAILSRIPSRTLGNVSNIVRTVRWLIEADYVNGALIPIDGGI